MAQLLTVPTFANKKGSILTETPEGWGKTSILEGFNSLVPESGLSFEIKRVFWVYGSDAGVTRGGHSHKKTIQALISVSGSYEIYINNGQEEQTLVLDDPSKCLVLAPEDWHTMTPLDPGAVLMVISSEHYDPEDYIDEKPRID